MNPDRNPLLCRRVAEAVEAIRAEPERADALWSSLAFDYATTSAADPDVAAAIAARDPAAVEKILEDWDRDRRPRPLEDREMLKKAMKAFRKRLKLTRLDDESRLGVGATTKGSPSAIVGIVPPNDHPPAIWAELARQGRLVDCKGGMYGLAEEAGWRS
ncbi:MAG: hypothetical protein ACF8XB_20205 [Planctomycetota bacterium JB042]